MKKGDIVIIPFPFTDLSSIKNRPALILNVSDIDIIVAFITTQPNFNEESEIKLEPNPINGLKKISYLKLNKLMTLDKKLIIGILGKLNQTELIDAVNKWIQLLKI